MGIWLAADWKFMPVIRYIHITDCGKSPPNPLHVCTANQYEAVTYYILHKQDLLRVKRHNCLPHIDGLWMCGLLIARVMDPACIWILQMRLTIRKYCYIKWHTSNAHPRLPVHLAVSPSIYPITHLSLCVSVCVPVCVPVCASVCVLLPTESSNHEIDQCNCMLSPKQCFTSMLLFFVLSTIKPDHIKIVRLIHARGHFLLGITINV